MVCGYPVSRRVFADSPIVRPLLEKNKGTLAGIIFWDLRRLKGEPVTASFLGRRHKKTPQTVQPPRAKGSGGQTVGGENEKET